MANRRERKQNTYISAKVYYQSGENAKNVQNIQVGVPLVDGESSIQRDHDGVGKEATDEHEKNGWDWVEDVAVDTGESGSFC